MSDAPARTPPPPRPPWRPIRAASDKVAALFGVAGRDRDSTVAKMLAASRRAAGGYWLQLVTAMAIATLGLTLGSTAVVIGAMLISPLMTPILELGMGLAIGSPLLVVRSTIRAVVSALVVVVGAAAITFVLPIHEMTSEISARTSPTVLDLAVASCCAVAGVYAAIRPGSDTTSTAAGTAIGIALVPPLCVVGYGLGTNALAISSGAALLFTANLCAIVLLSVVGFIALGYPAVPVSALEREHAEEFPAKRLSGRVARRLSLFFASRASAAVRIGMPLSLVVAVFLPLRSALAEVTWEIRVRTAVQSALRSLPGQTVHSSVRIERREIAIRVITIGRDAEAKQIRQQLLARVASASADTPASVEVITVADSHALARADAALRERPAAPAILSTSVSAPGNVSLVRSEIDRVLASWPADSAGPLEAWHLTFPTADSPEAVVDVVHLGPALGANAESVLGRSLSSALGATVKIHDVALATEAIEAPPAQGPAWLLRAGSALAEARALVPMDAHLIACVGVPSDAEAAAVAHAVRQSSSFAEPRAHVDASSRIWSLRWSRGPCAAAADAGPTDASVDAGIGDAQ